MTNLRSFRESFFPSIYVCLIILVAVSSCSDDPTLLNSPDPSSFVHTGIVIRDTTVEAISDSSFKKAVPTIARQTIVGRFGDYVALTALQFLQGSLPIRDTVQVLSARLRLRAVSWFGDSTAPLGFTVHRISRGWTPTSLNWDSVHAAGFYEETPTRGTYSGPIMSDSEYVYMQLDTAMVREWFATSTYAANYGILLVPNAGTTVARGFTPFSILDSAQFYPRLEVISRGVIGGVQDTIRDSVGFSTFVANINNLNSNPALLYAQAGVVYRSILRFDVSGIPRGATIASAELTLARDPATSRFNKFIRDTVVAIHVLRDNDVSIFEAQGSFGRRKAETATMFSFDARHAVQLWLRETNHGLVLRVYDEFNSLDLYTFHGHLAADPVLRPKITIKYVLER